LLLVAALACYLLAAAAAAQEPTQDEAYHVRALRGGGSQLREIGGEKVLEFPVGVRIVHGDVTITSDRGLHYANVRVTRLIGNVKIVQQTMTMWGDEGVYTGTSDEAVLRRNVRIVDEGWEVTCDRATYSRNTGDAWLTGNVVARDSTTILRADSLFYNRNTERSEAFGNVELTNSEEGFTARGRHGTYYRATGEGVIDRSPSLTVDPDTPEPVTIVSDTMRVFPDSSEALAYYRVKIIKGNTVTQCDSAALFDNRNRAELYGDPLARQDNVSMSGHKMVLHYDDDEVHRIDILGGAEIREAQRDSLVVGRDSWMQGDTVSLYLHENAVDSIDVLHNATSEYFPKAPPYGGKVESNRVRGDKMFFRFQNDSLTYVRVTGSASGVYRYVDLDRDQTVDSLRAVADTTLSYKSFAEKQEKVVYSAKNLEYFADSGDLVLDESAKVRYQESELTGDDIIYYSSQQLLDATGSPVLTEKGDKFYGQRMNYDMESEAGLVLEGSTKFQEGYYTGRHVAKVSDNEMKVWGSRYTTCNLKVPHYHFKAAEMKVYPRDKVITGPIWLYIGETPIAYLPFMAANLRRGRRSGILRPEFEFGFDRGGGRYMRNWGYYWATNDYTDFTFRGDFNEDSDFRAYIANRYALRYRFTGNVNYNFFRNLRTFRNEWEVSARHQHTLGERFSLNADVNFVSSDAAPSSINRIDNVDRVTERVIRSNVSLSKQWDSMGFSASASRTQNLNITDPNAVKVRMTLPDVRLSIPSRNLYFGKASREGKAGFWETLLTNTRFSPSLSGRHTYEEKEYEFQDVITINQGLSFQSPQKVSFINVSPQLRFSNATTRTEFESVSHVERQVDQSVTPPDTFAVVTPYTYDVETENSFSWNTGVSANTNIYGTFYPRIGRLRGVRHKISPSVGWTYTPDIGNRGPARQSFSVGLNQSLDLKVLRAAVGGAQEQPGGGGRADRPGGPGAGAPADSAGAEEQLDRLDGVVIWSLSSSYNPEPSRGQREWSNVNSRINTRLLGTSVSLSQTIDPYEGRVTYTSVTSGLTFRGTHPFGRAETLEMRDLNVVAAADTAGRTTTGDGESPGQSGDTGAEGDRLGLQEGRLPWMLSMDVSYTRTENSQARSTLRLNGSFDLTRTWSFTYRSDYDVEARELRGQAYTVSRDLHCWEMSFSRQKLGDEWQFYFKINLKAHPEIYAEQGRRGLGGGTFGTSSLGF
jgi:lipopolysaccharide assembly outer membrane protein LptD (OstA)